MWAVVKTAKNLDEYAAERSHQLQDEAGCKRP